MPSPNKTELEKHAATLHDREVIENFLAFVSLTSAVCLRKNTFDPKYSQGNIYLRLAPSEVSACIDAFLEIDPIKLEAERSALLSAYIKENN